jgi:putative ABC transport system permease protein
MSPRWRKVLADLWSNKTRSLLVVLSIAVGVLAVGTVLGIQQIVAHDMNAGYLAIHPAQAQAYTTNFNDDFLYTIQRMPEIAEAEGRATVGGIRAVTGPEQKVDLTLTSAADLAATRFDRLKLVQGTWPAKNEIVVERLSLGLLRGATVGSTLTLELDGGQRTRTVRVAGIVQDLNAGIGATSVQAYSGLDTVEAMGQSRDYNQLYFTVAEHPEDPEHVQAVGQAISRRFELDGGQVGGVYARPYNQHPAQSSTDAILGVLGALGLFSLVLSSFLVVNTTSALLTQHVRQIGMMKAIGGRTGQIVGMYLGLMLCFGVLALFVALPLSTLMAWGAASFIAYAFNFDLLGFGLPWPVVALEVVLCLLVPLLAGLVPVLSGARLTVQAAITSYGLGKGRFGRGWFDKGLERIRFLSRPLLISLRNTFRRKSRLVLTLTTLTLAGAVFIGVVNVSASMSATIDQVFAYLLSDINLNFDRVRRTEEVVPIMEHSSGVEVVEAWSGMNGDVLGTDDIAVEKLVLFGVPINSQLLKPSVLEGRWVIPGDQNAIVIPTSLRAKHPGLKVGDTLRIKLGTHKQEWIIVGIFQFMNTGDQFICYTGYDYLAKILNQSGRSFYYQISTREHTTAFQNQVSQALQADFKRQGISVYIQTGGSVRDSISVTLNVITAFLMGMTVLIALVGGIGLMGTMGMNVIERTREIGVMRAIGASNGTILRLVLSEGMLIGAISWLIGVAIATPISQVMTSAIGQALFQSAIPFVFDWGGVLAWLVVVVIISGLSSVLPAWNAARLTVREVLAYE